MEDKESYKKRIKSLKDKLKQMNRTELSDIICLAENHVEKILSENINNPIDPVYILEQAIKSIRKEKEGLNLLKKLW